MTLPMVRATYLRRLVVAAMGLFVLLASGPARADHEAAKQLFRAGRAAYERGDFRAAAASFEQAARAEPHPQAWYAAADSWATAGVADRAVYAFEQALDAGELPAPERSEVERRLAKLTPTLGRVDLDGPAGTVVAVAFVSRLELPAHLFVEPGEVSVRLLEPPHAAETRTASVRAGETVTIRFAYDPPPSPEPSSSPTSSATLPNEAEPDAGAASAPAVAGWLTLGLGLATGIAAAVVTSEALDARDEWEADRRDTALLDRAEGLRTATTVTWIASGVLTAAGAVVLIVDAATGEPDTAGSKVALRVGSSGLDLLATW